MSTDDQQPDPALRVMTGALVAVAAGLVFALSTNMLAVIVAVGLNYSRPDPEPSYPVKFLLYNGVGERRAYLLEDPEDFDPRALEAVTRSLHQNTPRLNADIEPKE